MKKKLNLFIAVLLALSVVISLFPAAFASDAPESLSTNSPARAPSFSNCPSCGAYGTVVYLGIVKTSFGSEGYYLEWTYRCTACGYTFSHYVY